MTTEQRPQQKIDHLTEFYDSRNMKKSKKTHLKQAMQIANYHYFMRNLKK